MECIVHSVAKSRTRLIDFHFHLVKNLRIKKKNSWTGFEVFKLYHFPKSTKICNNWPRITPDRERTECGFWPDSQPGFLFTV